MRIAFVAGVLAQLLSFLFQFPEEVNAQDCGSCREQLAKIYDQQIEAREKLDQTEEMYGRRSSEFYAAVQTAKSNDAIQIQVVSSILDNYGWLDESVIGKTGIAAITNTLQKADVTVKRKYISLLRKAFQNGQLRGEVVATIEDLIAISEDGRQLYGTQIRRDSTGTLSLVELKHPNRVDKFRRSLDMEPLKESTSKRNIKY